MAGMMVSGCHRLDGTKRLHGIKCPEYDESTKHLHHSRECISRHGVLYRPNFLFMYCKYSIMYSVSLYRIRISQAGVNPIGIMYILDFEH